MIAFYLNSSTDLHRKLYWSNNVVSLVNVVTVTNDCCKFSPKEWVVFGANAIILSVLLPLNPVVELTLQISASYGHLMSGVQSLFRSKMDFPEATKWIHYKTLF